MNLAQWHQYRIRAWALLWGTAFVSGLLVPTSSWARSTTEAIARDVENISDQSKQTASGNNGERISSEASVETPPGAGDGVSTASASAIEGRLGVSTFAFASATPGLQSHYVRFDAQARAHWDDEITFTSGVPGEPIFSPYTLEGELFLTGFMTAAPLADGDSSAFANTTISIGSNVLGVGDLGQLARFTDSPTTIDNPIGNRFTFRRLVPTGVPLFIDFDLAATSIAEAEVDGRSGSAMATAASTYGRSLVWGGITRVLDSTGSEITGYSIASRSGFDYTVSAVPEPEVYASLLVGIALLFSIVRRKRRETQ